MEAKKKKRAGQAGERVGVGVGADRERGLELRPLRVGEKRIRGHLSIT